MKAQPRPLEGECLNCGETFAHPIRSQGGGALRKYCSSRCRAYAWTKQNSIKRKAAVTKYESKEENIARKRLANRKRQLALYGWNEAAFKAELARQNGQCAGCLRPLPVGGKVDHNHKTGQVRGILCDGCNRGIGFLKENPMTMRRLMAYLERDRDKRLVYITGALKNPRIPHIGNLLRAAGFDVMDEWFTPGEHADENWQEYERIRGRSYMEALKGRAATNIFMFDRAYLDLADVAILVMPAGKSAMLELGYAKGRNKKTVLFLDGEDPSRYDIMPNIADIIVFDESALAEACS